MTGCSGGYPSRRLSGMLIYVHGEAEFGRTPDGWRISAAIVESDRGIYRRQDDSYESASLEALIDGTLLGVYDGPGR